MFKQDKLECLSLLFAQGDLLITTKEPACRVRYSYDAHTTNFKNPQLI